MLETKSWNGCVVGVWALSTVLNSERVKSLHEIWQTLKQIRRSHGRHLTWEMRLPRSLRNTSPWLLTGPRFPRWLIGISTRLWLWQLSAYIAAFLSATLPTRPECIIIIVVVVVFRCNTFVITCTHQHEACWCILKRSINSRNGDYFNYWKWDRIVRV